MSAELRLLNRQRSRRIDPRELKTITQFLLADLLAIGQADLAIHLVGAVEMSKLNQTHLNHKGATDIITLDYSGDPSGPLIGELFICIDEAVIQARRFRTDWREELLRYVVHGALHLRGFDDLKAPARRKMKSEEERLLKKLRSRFRLSKLGRKPRLTR
jgi:rRNA maturation RNase YbeY